MSVMGAVGMGAWIMLWVLVVGLVLGVIFLMFWMMSFNVHVRLRKKTNTHDLIADRKGKIKTDKDGSEKLIIKMNLFKYKSMPNPPPEAISLSLRGKSCIELELSDAGGMRYIIKDSTSHKFKPLDSNDRVFHLNELDKRIRRQKKSFGELVQFLAPFITLIIILGMLLAFWGDVVEPFTARMGAAENFELKMMEQMNKNQDLMNEILKKEQIIRDQTVDEVLAEQPPE